MLITTRTHNKAFTPGQENAATSLKNAFRKTSSCLSVGSVMMVVVLASCPGLILIIIITPVSASPLSVTVTVTVALRLTRVNHFEIVSVTAVTVASTTSPIVVVLSVVLLIIFAVVLTTVLFIIISVIIVTLVVSTVGFTVSVTVAIMITTTRLLVSSPLSQYLCGSSISLNLLLAKDSEYNDKVITELKSLLANFQGLWVDNLAVDLGPSSARWDFFQLLILLVRCHALADGVEFLGELGTWLLENTLEGLILLLLARRRYNADLLFLWGAENQITPTVVFPGRW